MQTMSLLQPSECCVVPGKHTEASGLQADRERQDEDGKPIATCRASVGFVPLSMPTRYAHTCTLRTCSLPYPTDSY
eukprot:21646-Eustigmatos_ZCMA.PRE.1